MSNEIMPKEQMEALFKKFEFLRDEASRINNTINVTLNIVDQKPNADTRSGSYIRLIVCDGLDIDHIWIWPEGIVTTWQPADCLV